VDKRGEGMWKTHAQQARRCVLLESFSGRRLQNCSIWKARRGLKTLRENPTELACCCGESRGAEGRGGGLAGRKWEFTCGKPPRNRALHNRRLPPATVARPIGEFAARP